MGSKSARDVALELSELEIEEARIMRELREMDEKANVARLRDNGKADPRAVLNALLAECEREVREAKGFIKSTGPPLLIARCKRGDVVPPHATFLSRPKGTGVDFTIPVKLKEYNDAIKHPIFLDGIREKCKTLAYSSHDEYMADMRLLARNTAAFNKGPELSWVVQHSRLLVETADESVLHRRRELTEAAAAVTRAGGGTSSRPGKRKRTGTPSSEANGSSALNAVVALNVGQAIQIFWDSDRKWYLATVREKGEGAQVLVEYEREGKEWLDLQHEVKWRMPPARESGRSKRIAENAHKRKKGSSSSSGAPSSAVPPRGGGRNAPAAVVGGVGEGALNAVRDEMLQAVDDAKGVILTGVSNTVEARFVQVETALNRSDALHRVLLAVTDMQTSMNATVEVLSKNVESLQHTVAGLTARLGGQVPPPPIASADIGGTGMETEEAQDAAEKAADATPREVEGAEEAEADTDEVGKAANATEAPQKAADASEDEIEKVADAPASESVQPGEGEKEAEKAETADPEITPAKEAEAVEKDQSGDAVVIDGEDSDKEMPAAPTADVGEKNSEVETDLKKELSDSRTETEAPVVVDKAKEVGGEQDVEAKDDGVKETEPKDVETKDGAVEQNGVAATEKEAVADAANDAATVDKPKGDVESSTVGADKESSDSVQVVEVMKKTPPPAASGDGSPKKRAKSKMDDDSDSSSGSSSSDVSSSSDESVSSAERKNADDSGEKKEGGKEMRKSASNMSLDNAGEKEKEEEKEGSEVDAMEITQEAPKSPKEAGPAAATAVVATE